MVKELVDDIKIPCGCCGAEFTLREGSKMERDDPHECLDQQGWVKNGSMFTCPNCGARGIHFGSEPGKDRQAR